MPCLKLRSILPLVALCSSTHGGFSVKGDFSLFSGISMAVPHIVDEHDKSEDRGNESKLHLAISERYNTRVIADIYRPDSFWTKITTVIQIMSVL